MGSRGKNLSASLKRMLENTNKGLRQTLSENTSDKSRNEALFNELRENKVKFSERDTLFITRDQDGKITWLERGNEFVGLTHIQKEHASQFKKALGVEEADIPNYINAVVQNGTIVKTLPDKGGTKRKYLYKGTYYTVIISGSNGFIVTVYPERIEKK